MLHTRGLVLGSAIGFWGVYFNLTTLLVYVLETFETQCVQAGSIVQLREYKGKINLPGVDLCFAIGT